ncbi:MAG: hypothetical protein IKO92_05515 [Clostridia bacterium]|nr:hypothetical protein [Clostridia bacterium]MBR4662174.1 hypothetical protein [Clostridia bacterium]
MDYKITIFLVLFYGLPALSLIAVGFCVLRFVRAKKMQKKYPLTYTGQEVRKYKNAVIVSSVITGILITNHIGLMILAGIAIAHM